jgi:hypothetical protein
MHTGISQPTYTGFEHFKKQVLSAHCSGASQPGTPSNLSVSKGRDNTQLREWDKTWSEIISSLDSSQEARFCFKCRDWL